MTWLERRAAYAAAVIPAVVVAALGTAGAVPRVAQMTTVERLEGRGFWPTKGAAVRDDYVGQEACARCHAAKAATQRETAMARTLSRAVDAAALRREGPLTFAGAGLAFEITRGRDAIEYVVRDGNQAARARLQWAFGAGGVGQTFVFEHENAVRESRVSVFGATGALGFTPARALDGPVPLDDALGRVVPPREAARCFGCHSTASTVGGRLALDTMIPGVTCEACHGPGRAHVEAMRVPAAQRPAGTILNPQSLAPADAVDFCGACHATYWDVVLAGERGIAALRSQPYRLQSSACWGDGDSRLACVACHDPHAPLAREARAYDTACGSCHDGPGARRPAPATCRAAGACTACHMPKYTVAEMHAQFTDHRIVKP